MNSESVELPIVDATINEKIRQFLYYEMELLDDRKLKEWLSLFSADLHYWMPLRRVRPPRERKKEITSADELSIYDETKADLEQRVNKIETGKAWAEEPPSRTRHCLANIRVRSADDGYAVRSNVIVFQGRNDRDREFIVGERFDLIREDASAVGGLSIYKRTFIIDDATLNVPSVSIFF